MKKAGLFILVFIAAALLAGCYMVQNPDTNIGSAALNVTVPSRALTDNGLLVNDAYMVGFLIDASLDVQIRDKVDKFQSGQIEFSSDEIMSLVNMVFSSLVLFDGGNAFFQVPIKTLAGSTGAGVCSIAGVPADKEYFMAVMVLNHRINDVMDLVPKGSSTYSDMGMLAVSNIRYMDALGMNYTFTSYPLGNVTYSNTSNPLPANGWYYFQDCEIGAGGAMTGTIWCLGGAPVSAGPYKIESGKSTVIPVLLHEF